VKKALCTRIYYSKQNAQILANPVLHAQALLDSFSHEKISTLIEDFFRFRVEKYTKAFGGINASAYDLTLLSDRLKYSFSSETEGYECEDEVNRVMGVGLSQLYSLILSAEI